MSSLEDNPCDLKKGELLWKILRTFSDCRILTPAEVRQLRNGEWKAPPAGRPGGEAGTAGVNDGTGASLSLFDPDIKGGGK